MSEQTDGGKLVELAADFTAWDTPTLAAQCRMQARENLDPEYSRFMEEVAVRLSTPSPDLKADNAALVEAAIAEFDAAEWTDCFPQGAKCRELLAAAYGLPSMKSATKAKAGG